MRVLSGLLTCVDVWFIGITAQVNTLPSGLCTVLLEGHTPGDVSALLTPVPWPLTFLKSMSPCLVLLCFLSFSFILSLSFHTFLLSLSVFLFYQQAFFSLNLSRALFHFVLFSFNGLQTNYFFVSVPVLHAPMSLHLRVATGSCRPPRWHWGRWAPRMKESTLAGLKILSWNHSARNDQSESPFLRVRKHFMYTDKDFEFTAFFLHFPVLKTGLSFPCNC